MVVAAEIGLGRLVVVAVGLELGRLVVVAADLGLGRLVVVALSFPRSFLLHMVLPRTLPRSASSSPGSTSFLVSASDSSRLLSRRWLFAEVEELLVSPSRPNGATRVFDVVYVKLIFPFRSFFIPPLLPAARACCLFSSVVRPHRLSGIFRKIIVFSICTPPISLRSP